MPRPNAGGIADVAAHAVFLLWICGGRVVPLARAYCSRGVGAVDWDATVRRRSSRMEKRGRGESLR